jgi:hypothetical protein
MTTTKPSRRAKSAAPLRMKRAPTKRAAAPNRNSKGKALARELHCRALEQRDGPVGRLGIVLGQQIDAFCDATSEQMGPEMVKFLGLEEPELQLAYVINRDGFWREVARRATWLSQQRKWYAEDLAPSSGRDAGYGAPEWRAAT